MNSHKINKSGIMHHYEIRFIALIFHGKPAVCLLFRDVTERELRKKYEEKEKNTFRALASVSHEFRTPLNVIISMLQSMKQKRLTNSILKDNLIPAENSAKLLLHLVNDILDIHQIQEKKIKIVPISFNLKEVIQQTLTLFTIQAEHKNIKLSLEFDDLASENITNDPNRFRQIIINLVGNAMKFTIKGGITIRVEEISQKKFLVKVIDTGIGITKTNLNKLFKAFGKVENVLEQELNPQGVGLGLVISNQLAKLLCLDESIAGLNVKSTPNIGSTFFFYLDDLSLNPESFEIGEETINSIQEKVSNLPKFSSITRMLYDEKNNSTHFDLSSQNLPQTSTIAESAFKELPTKELFDNFRGSFILIVDDNMFNQLALKELLKPLGFNIDLANNGKEAIEKIEASPNKYSLIFLDYEMPILNGLDCAVQLIKLMNNGIISKIPIIGQSGHGEDHKKLCLSNGMSDYLQKPASINDIVKILTKWLIQ